MVDTVQTKDGAVAISAENLRSSTRSTRRGKSKNIATPHALAVHLRANGKKLGEGIADLYEQFEKESPTFFAFFNPENKQKNKFPNEVFLADHTRVVLNEKPDYYHASYVDGCTQAKQYILAQAPFTEYTAADFFRLVMQCKPKVIVALMDLNPNEENQYILPANSKTVQYGELNVKCLKEKKSSSKSGEQVDKYNKFTLVVSKSKEEGEKVEQKFPLLTLNTWVEDLVIPADDFVEFHKKVHKEVGDKPKKCSQLVVCPSGAYRAGIWAVFDTEAERLQTKNRIRFSDTIKSVRNQRLNTIEHFELFNGLLNLLVTYAKAHKT